jgi:hypothetical protein
VNRVNQNTTQRADAGPRLQLAWIRQSVFEHGAVQTSCDGEPGGKSCITADAKSVQWGMSLSSSAKEKGVVSIQEVTNHTPQKGSCCKQIERRKNECLLAFIIKSEQLFTIISVSISKNHFQCKK